jgi:hypothetical protein
MDIVKDIITRILELLGHLNRMQDNRIPKAALDAKLEGKRKVGRQNLGWLIEIQVDLQMTQIKE